MKYYTIAEFGNLIGKTCHILSSWDENNVFKPHHAASSGYRYYSQEMIEELYKNEDII
jgi:putative resolvase